MPATNGRKTVNCPSFDFSETCLLQQQVNNHFPLRKYYNKFQSFYPHRKYRLIVALSAAAGQWIDIVLLEQSLPHGRVSRPLIK